MPRFKQFFAVTIVGLSLPFTAWGLGANIDPEPGISVWDMVEDSTFELPPDIAPPECKLKHQDSDAGESEAQPVACCWVYYFGRYWCVAC